MTVELPQELIDLVIDLIAVDSWLSLSACSLVCRSWVSRTRSHLFQRCKTLMTHNILYFLDLQQSPFCTFLTHVRIVRFSIRRLFPVDAIATAAGQVRLTDVRTLEMRVQYSGCPEGVYSFLASAFPDITNLHLSSDTRVPLPLMDFISCFPALRELRIKDCDRDSDSPYTPFDAIPPPGLRSLDLAGNAPGPILAWLHAAGHLPNVDSVRLHQLRSDHIPVARTALPQIGRALRTLDLSLDLPFDMPTLSWLDLSPHPGLRSLAIRCLSGDYHDFGANQVLPLLSTLAAPNLERLEMDFNRRLFQPADWTTLDVLLCPARFPCLQHVMAVLPYGPYREDNADFLAEALPMLEATGVLCSGYSWWEF
ncbi:hypothetical protein B0H14DRAFT_1702172 [Mycena olivaceomarginata]|nr:hypothetical protein B0H14DRAFT_1702172 [Mycena olivaceomarginata]